MISMGIWNMSFGRKDTHNAIRLQNIEVKKEGKEYTININTSIYRGIFGGK